MKLEIQSVVKDYHIQRALDRVSFDCGEHDVVGLIGPNGAGKTTLVKLAANLMRPTEGGILLDGVNVIKAGRGRIGLLSVDSYLYNDLTVDENLELYAKLGGAGRDDRKRYIGHFDLGEIEGKLVRELSFGQKKRVSLARVMLGEPDVLLLDEPFLGLDLEAADELVETIIDFKDRGKLVVVATHHLEIAQRIISKLVILKHGRLIYFDDFDGRKTLLSDIYRDRLERAR